MIRTKINVSINDSSRTQDELLEVVRKLLPDAVIEVVFPDDKDHRWKGLFIAHVTNADDALDTLDQAGVSAHLVPLRTLQ
jgi:hypothetical protein